MFMKKAPEEAYCKTLQAKQNSSFLGGGGVLRLEDDPG